MRIIITDSYVLLVENFYDITPYGANYTARIHDGQTATIVRSPICYENNWWQQVRFDTGSGLRIYWMQAYDPNHGLVYTNQLD